MRLSRAGQRRTSTFAIAVVLAATGCGSSAWAQSLPDDQAPDTADTVANETDASEIIVTAQRRSERLIDVPISISAATAKQLAAAGVDTTRGLSQITPGLVILNAGASLQPSIRGIQSQGTNIGEESNVSLYIDDVYIPSQSAGLLQLADTERTEVLKGPQGTLFGRNSTGGAIRITTRVPTSQPTLELVGRYGFELNQRQLSLYASTPISDRISVSLAGLYIDDDGYIENVNPLKPGRLGQTKVRTGRMKVLFEPNASSTYTLSADVISAREGTNVIAVIDNQSQYRNMPGVIIPTKPYKVANSQVPQTHHSGWGASFRGEWSLGAVDLKSTTAYRVSNTPDVSTDSDRTNLSISSADQTTFSDSFSQDFNLASAGHSRFSWVAGLFYFRSWSDQELISYSGNLGASILSGRNTRLQAEAIAGYGEVTYDITDKISLTGGLRGSYEKKRYQYHDLVRSGGLPLREADTAASWSNLSYRGVVRYQPDDASTFYLSYGTGFKAGVFNTTIPEPNAVNPEIVKALEVGAKVSLARGVFATAAIFDYSYDDIQVASLVVDALGQRNLLTNAANAKVRGGEVSLSASLGDLALNAGLSWIPTSKYLNFKSANVYFDAPDGGNILRTGYDVSGTRMIRAPALTANIGGQYERSTPIGRVGLSANYAYNSGFWFAPGQVDQHMHQKAFGILNGSVGWKSEDDRFEVSLYALNLTGEVYYYYRVQTANSDSGQFARPRELGLQIGVKFR